MGARTTSSSSGVSAIWTASVRYPLARPPRRGRGGGQTGAGGGSVAGASKPCDDAGPPQLQVGFYNMGINQQQLRSEKGTGYRVQITGKTRVQITDSRL